MRKLALDWTDSTQIPCYCLSRASKMSRWLSPLKTTGYEHPSVKRLKGLGNDSDLGTAQSQHALESTSVDSWAFLALALFTLKGGDREGLGQCYHVTCPLGVDVTKVIDQTAYARSRSEIERRDSRRHWGPGAFMISYKMEPEVDEKWEQEKTKAENVAIKERVPNKKFLTYESYKDTGKAGAFLKS